MQPKFISLSIIRVELSDKALFLSVASPISSPFMGEDKGEGGEVFAKD